jgi:hypothetical protein
VVWFQVEVRGLPVHVREMGTGANAIDAAYRVIGELRKLQAEWNEKKKGRAHFENEHHPINLNIGKIEGGDWASSVPAWCRIDCRISIYPGWSAEDASREIQDRIAKFALSDKFLSNIPPAVTFNGFHAEGYFLEPGFGSRKRVGQRAPVRRREASSELHDGRLPRYPRLRAIRQDPCALLRALLGEHPRLRRASQSVVAQADHFDDGALYRGLVRTGSRSRISAPALATNSNTRRPKRTRW